MAGVRTLEGHEHPAAPALGGGEVEGEAGVAVGEAPMDVPVGMRLFAPLVDVDVGLCEEAVGHCVGAQVERIGLTHGPPRV